ncbi:hypothetical protein M5D96_008506 [Drosophila gunungcola]|uniref:Uncharacterized protein n=2 Tax=Drosophila gunungcola TaxID=103775 RepID=A0A9P9YKE3_9MUSC|nr:hypothetical protein M5D96_008506 [Drosophila gunungcola]
MITLRSAPNDIRIKVNAEICGLPQEKEWEELHDMLNRMTNAVVEEFLNPEENGLTDSSAIQQP